MQWENTYHSQDKNMKKNYYIKDHLGNVRETYKIPNAGTKECVQRMFSHFTWINDKKTTGNSQGRIFIKRDKATKGKKR